VFKLIRDDKGQTTFEYAVVLGVVVLALGMMQVYFRRGIQASIKIATDELGLQQDSVELDAIKGSMQNSVLYSSKVGDRKVTHHQGGGREISVDEKDEVSGSSEYWSDWEEE
jgi:uncharacterized protein (UPF0333 family)